MLDRETIENWRTTFRSVFEAEHDAQLDALCDMALRSLPGCVAGWISVNERLPIERRAVIVLGGVAYWLNPCPQWPDGQWFTVTGCDWPGRQIMWEVTHWMPLPELPAAAPGGKGE